MTITPLHEIVHFKTKHSLVKAIIYLKLLEKDIVLPNNVLNVLALFGVNTDKDWVIETALQNDFYKSDQTIDNTISTLVKKYKLLSIGDKREKTRVIDKDIFPESSSEFIAATLKVHNIQAN